MKKITTISHDSYMKKALADHNRAAEYLDAAAAYGELKYLLVAIRRVVGANGGMGALAKATKLSRTTLYKTLSPAGNPEVATLEAILAVYGIRIGFYPIKTTPGSHKHSTAHGHHYPHP
jgi:probable addiction module antidote protein